MFNNSVIFPELPRKISKALNASVWGRRLVAFMFILVLAFGNLVDTTGCWLGNGGGNIDISNCTSIEDSDRDLDQWSGDCPYPSYFTHLAVPVLIAATLPAQLSYFTKTVLLLLIAIGHAAVNLSLLSNLLDCQLPLPQEYFLRFGWWFAGKESLSILLLLVAIILASFARHMEKSSRVLFLWKMEAEQQREMASDIRRRNEALVYNILPRHVAHHFLGNKKRQHEELYSQSYADVGVLFASMPNFSDFYSEETVNNQGLECLRFLNEVISDFDALLSQPKYQDIIKIKTIGSTYMAACGLNPTHVSKPEDPVNIRWAHLALLVEFAFELKKALQSINEQSFNHFVLKMGINHGPITAGVIGARKPHYDIWGNTVNVASRMESTGKAGYIQVTEETSEILRHFGYTFEQRGLVAVKGKGQLMTYYLLGKASGNDVSVEANNIGGGNDNNAASNGQTAVPTCDSAGPASLDSTAGDSSDKEALLGTAKSPSIISASKG